MALFKLMKGSASRLPSDKTNGYIWVTYDENNVLQMYIDYEDDNKDIQRGILSAEFANKLRYTADGTMVEIQPEDIALKTDLVQSDWNQNDENGSDYIKNRPFYQEADYVERKTQKIVGGDRQGDGTIMIFDPSRLLDKQNLTIEGRDTETFDLAYNDYDGNKVYTTGIRTVDGYITSYAGDSMTDFSVYLYCSAGFHRNENNELYCNIEYDGDVKSGDIKQLDEKFIPDTIARKAETVGEKTKDSNGNELGEIFNDYANNKAKGLYSHAEGASNYIGWDNSFIETNIKRENYPSWHPELPTDYVNFNCDYAHAEGRRNIAGQYSHVEGYSNVAIPNKANGTKIFGPAHAEGKFTRAMGEYSHSEGFKTVASGTTSHTEGEQSWAEGNYSHAEGQGTWAKGDYQHVSGKWNKTDDKALEVVGNGTNHDNRSNARTLDREGNAWFAGEVRVGSDNKKLLREDEVAQGNWNQNDENAPDYIKNRTHYAEPDVIQHISSEISGGDRQGDGTIMAYDATALVGRTNLKLEGRETVEFDLTYYDMWTYEEVTVRAVKTVDGYITSYHGSSSTDNCVYLYCGNGFRKANDYELCCSIEYDKVISAGAVHKLDEKFLPDTLAKKTEIIGKATKDSEGNILGEVFNDYANNQANGLYSHVEGLDNRTILPVTHVEGNYNTLDKLYGYTIVDYTNLENNIVRVQIGIYSDTYAATEGIEVGMTCAIYMPYPNAKTGWYRLLRGYITEVEYNEVYINTISTLTDEICDYTSEESSIFGKLIVNGGIIGYECAELENLGSFFPSHIEGQVCTATFISHAEGYNTQAIGLSSHSEGSGTKAIGERSHAEGYNTQAIGFETHAEGLNTIANGYGAHAEGTGTKASGDYSHSQNNSTKAIGNNSTAEGLETESQGAQSHSEGRGTKAIGENSHAEGHNNIVNGIASHGEGSTNYIGWDTAFVDNNINRNNYVSWHPVLEAEYKDFVSDYAHVEGYKNIAGKWSHAEGSHNVAIPNKPNGSKSYGASHAEGKYTRATGDYSHSEGFTTVASGTTAHAEGDSTWAEGNYSHTEGKGTWAKGEFQSVRGKWNIVDTNMLEIVGNGTSHTNRSNARTLDKNGNAWYAGTVRVGANNVKLIDETDLANAIGDINAILDAINGEVI